MYKIKKSFLILLATFSSLAVFAIVSPVSVDAARCYTETGPFRVQPRTHTCPAASTYVTYRDTQGNQVTDVLSLPFDRCFVSEPAAGPNGMRSYQEYTCSDLEILRTNAAREACTSTGGTYAANGVCSCPSGRQLSSSTGRCGGSSGDAPDPNTSTPGYVSNDCNNDSNDNGSSIDQEDCGITRYIVVITNVLSALVAVVVTISLIIAGIQYTMAGSDPQKVSTAKSRIRNSLIALFFFIFGYSFLNFLIPGGLL